MPWPSEPVWVGEAETLALHDRLLALDGGPPGVRSLDLLRSALARPRQHLAYGDAVEPAMLAALYTTGIVRNHPFVDGNKRTGFVVGVLFLELNGWTFTADEAEATQAVLALAAGQMDEAGYAGFLAANIA
jgi:death-on-curing protein